MLFKSMHKGSELSSNGKTELLNIYMIGQKAGVLEGDVCADDFHHASMKALTVKWKKLGRGKA